ncbi:class V lanthionine synthetase subunit LxmK [Streptomyces afghaniensis]|uniref:class V lanthionine synthetase subunit LxmK n=1 Tax=Streptomyces afghaniensis TaxID=66865 RepID=UPI00278B57A5|nr:class V lanthionine synthetase subunit LxmK [Streptomyces afghaniensis]MDQ1018099.1 hypothetical protein [Streptomyces afghaniensis]
MTSGRANRYRTSPTDLASVPGVESLLEELGLGTFVPGSVTSRTGRNDNWSGTTASGTKVFVKHLGDPARDEDARRRLGNTLAFEELVRHVETGPLHGPRCLGWSTENGLVVFELLASARSGAELADDGAFDEKHAYRVGQVIGTLHGLVPAGQVALDTSQSALPPVKELTALPLEAHRTASGAMLQLWSILQHDDGLADAIRRLRAQERTAVPCPIHCDFRLDQLLFADGLIHLLDLEELRLGDPARDIGAYIGEWLYRAVAKLPGQGTEGGTPSGTAPSAREVTTRGARELVRMRPLSEQFCAGYASTGRLLHEDLRVRSAGFAGWHLIDRVMARAGQSSVLGPVERAAIGIARTVLLSPQAATGTLGLED